VRVADRIITDFCAGFGGLESAMHVIRQQFEKAGMDVREPTRSGLLKVVDLLADVERATKSPEDVSQNRIRRILWVRAFD
jgi:KaiC/GvpD/RAD55 family RecA-like ATPase